MIRELKDRIAKWYWLKQTKAVKAMHWSTIPLLPTLIKLDNDDAYEVVRLTEWIESTQPMCIEMLELQMTARNSFSDLSDPAKSYMMNYIWQRTAPLHNAIIDRYRQGSLLYDFAHCPKPSIQKIRI